VGRCLDLRAGELLLIEYEPEHRELAVAIAAAAYGRGLRVNTRLRDPLFQRAELEHATEAVLGLVEPWDREWWLARTGQGAALVCIKGDGTPDALDGCDPARVALRSRRQHEAIADFYDRVRQRRDAFVILAYPTLAWASRAYPELASYTAQRTMAENLLSFCRIGPDDPPEALDRHIVKLRERAEIANQLRLCEVRFRGPDTDLRVGLTHDAVWCTAECTNAYGRTIFRNLPSEEIFTAPAASATEGTVRCTRPLSARGILCEELRLEFRGGRLARVDARTESQRDILLAQLKVDEGGLRLGELALVDAASRVGRLGRIFWNTLLDENQACHVALGLGFPDCRRDGGQSADLNRSKVHYDVTIGAPDVEVTGKTATGEIVPLIVDGTWRPT
jgi:aminopeptidase